MTRSDARKRLAQCADIRATPEYADIRTLPAPACPRGYTSGQLDTILGDQMPAFRRWMSGQSVGVCDGYRFNPEARDYELTACGDLPHGVVTYVCDVQRFLGSAA